MGHYIDNIHMTYSYLSLPYNLIKKSIKFKSEYLPMSLYSIDYKIKIRHNFIDYLSMSRPCNF